MSVAMISRIDLPHGTDHLRWAQQSVEPCPSTKLSQLSLLTYALTDKSAAALFVVLPRQGASDGQSQSRWQTAAAPSRMVAKRATPETSGSRHAINTKATKLSSTTRPSPPTKGAMLPPQLRGRCCINLPHILLPFERLLSVDGVSWSIKLGRLARYWLVHSREA